MNKDLIIKILSVEMLIRAITALFAVLVVDDDLKEVTVSILKSLFDIQ